jgi:hypothetical protein
MSRSQQPIVFETRQTDPLEQAVMGFRARSNTGIARSYCLTNAQISVHTVTLRWPILDARRTSGAKNGEFGSHRKWCSP